MLYRLIIGLLAGQASGLMFAPLVSTPGLRTAVSPVMQYGGYQQPPGPAHTPMHHQYGGGGFQQQMRPQ